MLESFTLGEYYAALLRSRDLIYVIKHFWNSHLFDLIHGTDTHVILPKSDYSTKPGNFVHGTYYQASWSGEVTRCFHAVRHLLGPRFSDFVFLDIGCGKGKAVLHWKLLCRRHRLDQDCLGLDYYAPLIDVARANGVKMFGTGDFFHVADAARTDFAALAPRFVVYLFNPFSKPILQVLLDRLETVEALIVYANPAHGDLLLERGYRPVWERPSKREIERTVIYGK